MRKSIFVFYSIFLFQFCFVFSQQEVVKLTTNGYGQNENEAVTDALKMAVENSFGVYISTETQIINDELIKDEITSLGKGSILSYNITDQKKLGESNYIVTVDSEVSIVNLKTFAASKGVEVDFEGALFASNLKLQELNEQNEIKLVQSFIKELSREFRKSVEFTIKYDEPVYVKEKNWEGYKIQAQIDTELNKNSKNIEEMLDYFSKSITMDIGEVENYIKLGKPVYPVYLTLSQEKANCLFLRTSDAFEYLAFNIIILPNFHYSNFLFDDGQKKLTKHHIIEHPYSLSGRYLENASINSFPVWKAFEKSFVIDSLKNKLFMDVYDIPKKYLPFLIGEDRNIRPFDSKNLGAGTVELGFKSSRRESKNRRPWAYRSVYDTFNSSKIWINIDQSNLWGVGRKNGGDDKVYVNMYQNYTSYGYDSVKALMPLDWLPTYEKVWEAFKTRSFLLDYGKDISKLAKEKYGKDFGKRVEKLRESFWNYARLNNPARKAYSIYPLMSIVFDLYYTKDELSKIKKFSVKQSDLPFPLIKKIESIPLERKYGQPSSELKYSFDLNREERLNVVNYMELLLGPDDVYGRVRSSLKKVKEKFKQMETN